MTTHSMDSTKIILGHVDVVERIAMVFAVLLSVLDRQLGCLLDMFRVAFTVASGQEGNLVRSRAGRVFEWNFGNIKGAVEGIDVVVDFYGHQGRFRGGLR